MYESWRIKKVDVMNFFAVILDSCRYDTFEIAHTPNFDKIGELEKGYSPAGWTLPSITAYSVGTPPLNISNNTSFWTWKENHNMREFYKHAAFLTSNPIILQNRYIFRKFDIVKGLKYDYNFSCDKIFSDSVNYWRDKDNFLLFTLLMETHSPYSRKDRTTIAYMDIKSKEEFMNIQAESVEIVDTEFGKIMNKIPKDTEIRILADHGELFDQTEDGEWIYHHNFSYSHIKFHKKLFEIPVIRGKI